MDNNTYGLLTVAEVAQRLGRSIEQVRRYLREGKLPGRRIGQQWFVEASALAEHAREEHRIGEAAAAYMPRPFGGDANVTAERGRNTETRRMDKDEIERLIAEVTALRERIRARRGGDDLPMTAAQLVRLDRDEH